MNGKIIINKPNICICCIKINGQEKYLGVFKNKQELDIPIGTHKINVGIEYLDINDVLVHKPFGRKIRSEIEWVWKEDKEIIIDEKIITIKIKRKWHLLKQATVEAIIVK